MAAKKQKPSKRPASASGQPKKKVVKVQRGTVKKAKASTKKGKLAPKKSKSKDNLKKSKAQGKRTPKPSKATSKKPLKAAVKKVSKANSKKEPKKKPAASKNAVVKATFTAEEIPVIKESDVIQGRKLGEGGFGKVVEGEREEEDSCAGRLVCCLLGTYRGRTVAVKMPLRKEDFEEALVEFKKLRNFRHRNVVEAIAYCKEPAMFVMEFMAGGTLNGWLHDGNNKHVPMNWFQGLALLNDIARGVKLLHDATLLHGDLSSNNVLLTGDHRTAKISDFGTVQMIEKYINASLAGQIDEAVGAFRWMAPQRLRFSKPDNYSDVWSYGCILIEFLTHPRKIPFSAASTGQLIAKLESYVEGDIRDLHIDLGEMDPEDPPALQDLMYRCLKAKRVERPDYGQIVDELETINQGLTKKYGGHSNKAKINNKRVHSSDMRTWR